MILCDIAGSLGQSLSDCNKGEEITQGLKFKRQGLLRAILEATYYSHPDLRVQCYCHMESIPVLLH